MAGFTTVVHVEVDEQTAEGEEDAVFNPSDLFDGNIPTAFCALQGFHSNLNLGQSQSVSTDFPHLGQSQSVSRLSTAN